jgi:hypothetical protein
MLVKLPLTDVPAVAEAIVIGFITNWLNTPGLTVSTCVAEVMVVGDVLAAVMVGVPALVSVYVKVALLDPLLIVSEPGVNVTVPLDELDNVTVRAPSVVFGLPYWSCRCTVMLLDATPAVVVTGVEVITSFVAAPGLTVVMVVVPTTDPEVAVIVKPLPAKVGVKVGKVVNTPAVNATEVPVAPAVPPNVTVPVNALGPLLQTLPLASFAVMLPKLPLIDVPTVAEAIVVGFITN